MVVENIHRMPVELHGLTTVTGGNVAIVPCEMQLHIFSVDFSVPYILEAGSVNVADRQRRIFAAAAIHVAVRLYIHKTEECITDELFLVFILIACRPI